MFTGAPRVLQYFNTRLLCNILKSSCVLKTKTLRSENVFCITSLYMLVNVLCNITEFIRSINPYKPKVIGVRHMQTVQAQIRRHSTHRLTRVSTVSLQNVLLRLK